MKTFTYSTVIILWLHVYNKLFRYVSDNLHVAYNNKAVLVYAGVYCIVLFNTLYIPVHGAFDEKTAHISDSSITCILFPSSDVYQGGKDTDQSQGYGIIWAVVMLIIGNWLKKYGNEYIEKIRSGLFLIAYTLCSVAIFISNYLVVKLVLQVE